MIKLKLSERIYPFYCQGKNFFSLCLLREKLRWQNLIAFCQDSIRYYPNPLFRQADFALKRAYFWQNPYRLCHRFFEKLGAANPYTYGETPLATMEKIVKVCALSAKDVVIDLGCGRGRASFWLATFIGCSVKGLDLVPDFIDKAQAIKKQLHLTHLDFERQDFTDCNLTTLNFASNSVRTPTFIYCYGTCLDEEQILSLIARFSALPKGVKVLTISYSILDYQPLAPFELKSSFSLSYPWGEACAYLHEKSA